MPAHARFVILRVSSDGASEGAPPRNGAIVSLLRAEDDAPLPDYGPWWASDAASSVLHALEEALQAAPSLRSERVEDVLLDPSGELENMLLRCVELAESGDAAPRTAKELADWGLSNWMTDNESLLAGCDAALLSHTFSWTSGTADGGAAEEELCLRTLVTTSAADLPLLQSAFFGQDAVLLRAEAGGSRCACVATLRRGSESRIITEQAVAALPYHLRSALKQRRREQVLSSLAACVRRRWLGGLLLLSDVAAPLLRADAASSLESREIFAMVVNGGLRGQRPGLRLGGARAQGGGARAGRLSIPLLFATAIGTARLVAGGGAGCWGPARLVVGGRRAARPRRARACRASRPMHTRHAPGQRAAPPGRELKLRAAAAAAPAVAQRGGQRLRCVRVCVCVCV
jgi:hypothetical protein